VSLCRYAEYRYAESRYDECLYAECRYAECLYADLIRNVLLMDRFGNKQEPYIVDHKHTNFDKHSSLLRNPYITNL